MMDPAVPTASIRMKGSAEKPKQASRHISMSEMPPAKPSIPSIKLIKFVSATSRKFVMTGDDGKEHSHSITDDTKVTCDRKDCKASDLKAGTKIRVTTKKSDEKAVTCIEAIVKDADFANQI